MKIVLSDEKIEVQGNFRNVHPSYSKGIGKTFNTLRRLFDAAQKECESEFIWAILEIDPLKPRYKPSKSLEFTYDLLNSVKNKKQFRGAESIPLALFTYGQILEADAPYNLLANMINILEGNRTRFDNNFTQRENADDIYPSDKVEQIINRSKLLGHNLNFLKTMHSSTLRNGVFHGNYSIADDHSIEIYHRDDYKKYKRDEWHNKVNMAIAFYECVQSLKKQYISSYIAPEEVDLHPNFSDSGEEKALTIIRNGHGVVGLRESPLTKDGVNWSYGIFLPYEIQMVREGASILPYSRVKRFNRPTRVLPDPIKRFLVKKYSRKIRGD